MRKPTNRIVLFTALCLLIPVLSASPLYARTFSNIVAFGNSLTDHGGAQSLIPEEIGFFVPEAWTNCPESGPCVWVEYTAEEWGAAVDNNAIGGALTEGHESEDVENAVELDLIPPVGLVGQVDEYVDDNPVFDAENTLFTVWIGGNDLLEFLRGESDAATPEELVAGAVGNIRAALNDLAAIGARHILVLSLPDISRTPRFVDRTVEERAAAQALVQNFNTALENEVNAFDAANPEITVYRFNVFTFFNRIIDQGTFANTTGTLLVDPDDPTAGTNEPADAYLFWDEIHPTTRAHELLGNAVAESVDDRDDDDDDDDDTCFIRIVADKGGLPFTWAAVLPCLAGLALMIRRNHR